MCHKHLVKIPVVNLTHAMKNHMYEAFLMLLLL